MQQILKWSVIDKEQFKILKSQFLHKNIKYKVSIFYDNAINDESIFMMSQQEIKKIGYYIYIKVETEITTDTGKIQISATEKLTHLHSEKRSERQLVEQSKMVTPLKIIVLLTKLLNKAGV